MGQYYKPYLKFDDGTEESYCPQNAIFMTRNGIGKSEDIKDHPKYRSYDFDDPDSWGRCFSGLKLMEHSWMCNDFVDGIIERIEEKPARIAWVGDYSDEEASNGSVDGYDMEIYRKVWSDSEKNEAALPELPFPRVPEIHKTGYLVNHSKSIYIDLARYKEMNESSEGWCVHPLPLLTEIGNGKGGGDYWSNVGANALGSWAMDRIAYYEELPEPLMEATYRFDSNV
jgi:hypothetical protein